MRDDPYPARFDGRQIDEPFSFRAALTMPLERADPVRFSLQQPLARLLFVVMTLYLICALFLIFQVSSYVAPLGSATISAPHVVSGDAMMDRAPMGADAVVVAAR